MSVPFFTYNADGRVLTSGYCPLDMIRLQASDGVFVASGSARFDTHYVQDGVLVAMPQRPSRAHTFNYTTKQWEPNIGRADSQARAARDRLLVASDWTQLPDVPAATKEAWATYRQALRDITAQPGYPLNVNWPEAPQ